jgi:hypothetical protein
VHCTDLAAVICIHTVCSRCDVDGVCDMVLNLLLLLLLAWHDLSVLSNGKWQYLTTQGVYSSLLGHWLSLRPKESFVKRKKNIEVKALVCLCIPSLHGINDIP